MMTASAWPVLALLWPLGEPSLLKLGTMREKWDFGDGFWADFGILGFFFPPPPRISASSFFFSSVPLFFSLFLFP